MSKVRLYAFHIMYFIGIFIVYFYGLYAFEFKKDYTTEEMRMLAISILISILLHTLKLFPKRPPSSYDDQ